MIDTEMDTMGGSDYTDTLQIGHEAEDAMKATADNGANDAQERPPSSELMGFRALGVVIGPLLLGNLVDQVQLVPPTVFDTAPRRSIDSGKKGDKKSEKKQKRNSGTDKLGRDAELSAHVDRANIMAAVLERLLAIWKDVVLQLQDENCSLASSNGSKHLPDRRQGAGSRDESSEDGGIFIMDALNAGPPATKFSGTFKMKTKVKKVGKSPMSRTFRNPSSDPFESQSASYSTKEMPVLAEYAPHVRVICASEDARSHAGDVDSHSMEGTKGPVSTEGRHES